MPEIYPSPGGIAASDSFNVDVRLNGKSKWQPFFVYKSVNKLNQDDAVSWSVNFPYDISLSKEGTTGVCI